VNETAPIEAAGTPTRAVRTAWWRRAARWVNPAQLAFGPVFQREMRVAGRAMGTYIRRAMLLLALLFFGTMSYLSTGELAFDRSTQGAAAALQSQQAIAQSLVTTVLWVMYIGAVLIAATSASSAVATERRGRTLDAVVGTTLSGGEVVVGHVAARTVQIIILCLLTVPVLLAVRVFGGVELASIAGATAVTLSTVLLAASLGVALSLFTVRNATAGNTTVVILFGMAVGPLMLTGFLVSRGWAMPPAWVYWFSHGTAIAELVVGDELGLPRVAGVPIWVGSIGVNLALTLLIALAASIGFRHAALSERLATLAARAGERRSQRRARREQRRLERRARRATTPAPNQAEDETPGVLPSASEPVENLSKSSSGSASPAIQREARIVSDHPVLWREVRQSGVGWVQLVVLVLAAGGLIWAMSAGNALGEGVVFAIVAYAGLVLLTGSVGVAASQTISSEREARTWGVLLTTRLRPWAILWGKAVGAMRRQLSRLVLWVALLVVMILAGAVPAFTLAMLALVAIPTLAFLACVGVVMSLVTRKATSATSATIIIGVTLWLILPVLTMLVVNTLNHLGISIDEDSFWILGLIVLTNPFAVLSMVFTGVLDASSPYEFLVYRGRRVGLWSFFALLGGLAAVWTGVSLAVLWLGTRLFPRHADRGL